MELKISELNDENLALQISEENEDAKDYLYDKFSPLIHKEINRVKKRARILGIEFADLSQEAMLAFSQAIHNFKDDGETKFLTFATLCIRRRLMNYIAKFETVKNKSMQESLSLDMTMDDEKSSLLESLSEAEGKDPLKQLINYETLRELYKIMEEKLSENERLALKYDLLEKSTEEISELMGMSNKQIYNLIFRARQKLKI